MGWEPASPKSKAGGLPSPISARRAGSLKAGRPSGPVAAPRRAVAIAAAGPGGGGSDSSASLAPSSGWNPGPAERLKSSSALSSADDSEDVKDRDGKWGDEESEDEISSDGQVGPRGGQGRAD